MKSTADVAIIGGGVAGPVAAWHLARQGKDVLLIEKSAKPHHKVCGEFISAEGIPYLKELGVDLDHLGATVITDFRLHGPRRSGEARLPATSRGLSRLKMDEALLEKAQQAGAVVERGVTVKGLMQNTERRDGVECDTDLVALATSHGDIRASTVICATGKSDFRPVQTRIGRDDKMVGYKIHLRLSPRAHARLRHHIDLFVFANGYGGLSTIEDGIANLCFLVERDTTRELGRDWSAIASYLTRNCRAFSTYLDDAQPLAAHPLTIAPIPYGFVHAGTKSETPSGVYCVGDQLAVIPSLTGDGMTIAMASARAASEFIVMAEQNRISRARTARLFHSQMRDAFRSQIGFGFHFHRLFKSPWICDRVASLIQVWPSFVGRVFERTRVPTLQPVLF